MWIFMKFSAKILFKKLKWKCWKKIFTQTDTDTCWNVVSLFYNHILIGCIYIYRWKAVNSSSIDCRADVDFAKSVVFLQWMPRTCQYFCSDNRVLMRKYDVSRQRGKLVTRDRRSRDTWQALLPRSRQSRVAKSASACAHQWYQWLDNNKPVSQTSFIN